MYLAAKASLLFAIALFSNQGFAQYCTPAITAGCGGGQITQVTVYDATQAVLLDNLSFCEAYGDFTGLTPIEMQAGLTYTVDATTSNTTVSVGATVGMWTVWVDWDQSGTFETTEATFGLNALAPSTMAIVVPPNAAVGQTRMRVKWDDAVVITGVTFDNAFACEGGSGEVEDYLVNVTSLLNTTPGCAQNPMPADAVIDICNSGSTLSFEAPEPGQVPLFDPTGYLISLWTDNGTISYLVQDSDIADVLSFSPSFDLIPGETYYWQIKPYNAVDTNKTCSAWSFITSTKPNPTPDVSVDGIFGDSLSVCSGLSSNLDLIDLLGTDLTGASYDWDGTEPTAAPLNDTLIPDPTFLLGTPDVTYNLVVNVTDDLGCVGVDSVKITTKPRAVAGTISAIATKICENESADLTLTGFTGDIEWKYANASSPSNYLTTGDFDSTHITLPILQNTFYTAIVDLDGCADSVTTLIEKKDLPFTPGINVQDTLFCAGDSVFLQAIWPGPGTYLWNNSDSSDTETIWVKESGVYNVTGIGLNECVAISEDIIVIKVDKPSAPIITEVDGIPCIGDSLVLQSSSNLPTSWFNSGVLVNNSYTYTVHNSTELSVVAFDSIIGSCSSDTTFYNNTFEITPIKPIVNQINNSDYYVNGVAMTYSWYKDTVLVFVGSDTIYSATENGAYYVVASNGLCESIPSDTFYVNLATSIDASLSVIEKLQFYPNPNNGQFNIKLLAPTAVKLFDINGREVYNELLNQGSHVIKLNVQPGTYIVEYSTIGSPRAFDRLVVH